VFANLDFSVLSERDSGYQDLKIPR